MEEDSVLAQLCVFILLHDVPIVDHQSSLQWLKHGMRAISGVGGGNSFSSGEITSAFCSRGPTWVLAGRFR